jgi:hypothetical protein
MELGVASILAFECAVKLVDEMKPMASLIAYKSNGKCKLSSDLIKLQKKMAINPSEFNVYATEDKFAIWKNHYKNELFLGRV